MCSDGTLPPNLTWVSGHLSIGVWCHYLEMPRRSGGKDGCSYITGYVRTRDRGKQFLSIWLVPNSASAILRPVDDNLYIVMRSNLAPDLDNGLPSDALGVPESPTSARQSVWFCIPWVRGFRGRVPNRAMVIDEFKYSICSRHRSSLEIIFRHGHSGI